MLRAFASGRLFGELYGPGTAAPWVLALHGWARDHRDFAAALAPREGGEAIDAIALDLPGFGATPAPGEPWGSPQYAAAVAEVLAEMAPRVVVLGHSFGGRVAVHLAAAHPEQVAGLVLAGVPLSRPDGARSRPAPAYRAIRSLARIGLVREPALERVRQRYGSADYRAVTGVMRSVFVRSVAEEYGAALAAVACPTILVWGEDDRETPLDVGRRAEAAIKGAELVVLPGTGHLSPTEAPGALRDALVQLKP